MLVYDSISRRLDISAQWLDLNQLRLAFRRTDLGIEYTEQEYYLTPQELSKLADYIRDVLAQ
jgi:hypothetical protein